MATPNEKWLSIPKTVRAQLRRNVWCAHCGGVVEIVSYVIKEDRAGILLEGKCATCGNDVARVIETDE